MSKSKFYPSYQEACEAARKLKIKTAKEYKNLSGKTDRDTNDSTSPKSSE
ncbi:hypothetical protein [Vibrio porteresiae]|uniref:Uncharacterized protein n=1 Tax=Vibrio porteresiae DSM 19223 TaxID=1123496 RepID=A0ABZ0QBV3_9VIBR|nr:hypothetical protein [Vibrio porteresiae]WPC73944.1 hypothetical protein R8Z52_01255 [Vibrio porteresiae DSM 19223]